MACPTAMGAAYASIEDDLRTQITRQIAHWDSMVEALAEPENFASVPAWQSLEHRLGIALRMELQHAVDRLRPHVAQLTHALAAARTADELHRVRRGTLALRRSIQQCETMIDFYGDAVNSRTGPRLGALLRACDLLAVHSMYAVLPALGSPVPPVLTYLDKGMGASILRAGVRLWSPGSISPVAAVKITRHNLLRPTALIHETGHQVAFSLGWNAQLGRALHAAARPAGERTADLWAEWAQEVAADTYAFAHTGYAAVAGLHDVIAGEPEGVYATPVGDPHPAAYLRVLLGTAMCREWYGVGPWDGAESAWRSSYPVAQAPPAWRSVLDASERVLSALARVCLRQPADAFGGRPLTALVDPALVAPEALRAMAAQAGPHLYSSAYWADTAPMRLLAWSGLRLATEPHHTRELRAEFARWMAMLGNSTGRGGW
ncbi:hypothetical protein ABZ464_40700 [Streptomyces sp. NPDC005820]|uniref:hypothetical protein n=1 Tax=Streptomyces sp. NPDC005820 TaxID=3157069 RepID=UPI0033CA7FD3